MGRKEFYLVKRQDRLTKGKPTFYCRFRNMSGDLMPWQSAGEITKTRAENWAIQKRKNWPFSAKDSLTFKQYSADWWMPEHEYVRAKEARGSPLSRNYMDAQRLYLNKHILPYFKDKRLTKITTHMIETWLLALKEKKGASGKPLSPTIA